MREPIYFGGMILSNFDETYNYEKWLFQMMTHRLERYKKRWSFFIAMLALFEKKKYTPFDFHSVPEDPLIHFDSNILVWSHVLSLKAKKLRMLEFEVFKYFRRKGYYPT